MTVPKVVPDDLDVLILLADSAESNNQGGVNAVNVGWWMTTSCRPAPQHHALMMWFTAPRARADERISYSATLLDSDGRPVEDDTPDGVVEVRSWGDFTPSVVAGLPVGLPVQSPAVVHNLTIARGLVPGVYQWRVELGEERRDHWKRTFVVIPEPEQ